MTQEEFKKIVDAEVENLRRMDVLRGLIDENFEPFNGRLPAEENERCWRCLAKPFVKNYVFGYLIARRPVLGYELFESWLYFLQDVNEVVKCGDRNGTIEDIINNSGISEETWVRFLD